jgi:hypothetical protein
MTAPDNTTRRTLVPADAETSPPLSLYQGPWTVALAIAFAFRGTGAYYIDDIDNAGVRRGQETERRFGIVRKEVMSKKGWTNCRPLTAFCPDGFLFANLASANYAALDRLIPLSRMAGHRSTTVEKLIRETSLTHGMWSLAGPDRAITGIDLPTAWPGLRQIIDRHEAAVARTLPRPADRERALERLRHLMPEPRDEQSLLSYFQECFRRGIALAGGDAPAFSAARELFPPDGGRLFPLFADRDPSVIEVYNTAATIQGSRRLSGDDRLPYYAVGLDHGERVSLDSGADLPVNRIIAPKILVLENVPRMVLPMTVAADSTVLAREYSYNALATGSSQVFFDSTWLESFIDCATEVTVDPVFQRFPGLSATMPVGELVQILLAHEAHFEVDGDPELLWAHWVLTETLEDLKLWHYPLLAYAIGGDAWLSRLTLRSYLTYSDI